MRSYAVSLALTAFSLGVLPAVAQEPVRANGAGFAGHWTGNLAQSAIRRNANIQSMSLDIAVSGDDVTLIDHTIDTSGRDVGSGTTTFRVDGVAHPHDALLPGLMVVATWMNPRLLDTVLTRPDGIVDHVTYEVAGEARRLTLKTAGPLGQQTFVFDRN